MKKILTVISLLCSLVGFSQGKILFEWNGDTRSDKFPWKETCCAYSITVDSTHGYNSKFSQRIELRKGETQMGNTDGKRSEAQWNGAANTGNTNTQMSWVRLSVMLDSSWIVDNLPPNGNPEAIFNMHDGEPCANRATNPFGIWVNGDHYEAVVNASPNTDYCSGGYGQIVRKATMNLGPIQPGKYVTFIVHFKNSIGNDGYDSVFNEQGKLLGSYRGPNWYKGIYNEPYLKFGIYKWGWSNGWPSTVTKRVLYQDNIKIGDTSCRINQFILSTPLPPQNQAPKANAGPDQTTAPGATSFTVNGSGTDPDGTIAGYLWEIFSTPTNWFGTSTNQNWLLTGAIPGVYKIKLMVTDNHGAKGYDTVIVTIPNANKPPVFDSGVPDSVVVTLPIARIDITAKATDLDGDGVAYKWTTPTGGSIDSARLVAAFATQGAYTYALTATDSKGASTSKTVKITVNPIPPKLIVKVDSSIDPLTGGYVVTIYHADGTTDVFK